MRLLILDPCDKRQLIRDRRRSGADLFDEVWAGVYVMSPIADNEHQYVAGKLTSAIDQAIGAGAKVFPAINVSDRATGWKRNFRCPDVAVFLPGNPALDCGTHWNGGPDFAVEVVSRYDRSRRKGAFYAKVGVRELLLVDRDPWRLEIYRSSGADMELAGTSTLEHPTALASTALSLTFQLIPGANRPQIEVVFGETGQQWLI